MFVVPSMPQSVRAAHASMRVTHLSGRIGQPKRVKGWRIAGRKEPNLAGRVGKSTVGAGITHHARANLDS
jgi:hypothetical protein